MRKYRNGKWKKKVRVGVTLFPQWWDLHLCGAPASVLMMWFWAEQLIITQVTPASPIVETAVSVSPLHLILVLSLFPQQRCSKSAHSGDSVGRNHLQSYWRLTQTHTHKQTHTWSFPPVAAHAVVRQITASSLLPVCRHIHTPGRKHTFSVVLTTWASSIHNKAWICAPLVCRQHTKLHYTEY